MRPTTLMPSIYDALPFRSIAPPVLELPSNPGFFADGNGSTEGLNGGRGLPGAAAQTIAIPGISASVRQLSRRLTPMRKWLPPQLIVFLLLIVLTPVTAWPQSKPVAQSSPAATTPAKSGVYEQLNLFGEAFERIRQDAVEPVGDQKLIETAIAGMLGSLDPNCAYLTEDEYKAQQSPGDQTTGSIGLVVTIDNGALKVVSPRDGSPAADAGIKPSETILEIDKQPVF